MSSEGGNTTVKKCVDNLSIKRTNVFSKWWHNKSDLEHENKLTNLCEILYGQTLPETSITSDDKDLFNNLIHLWFNDFSISEEIYHLFRLSGLCFLEEINFSLFTNDTKYEIVMRKHVGTSKYKESVFNSSKYKTTQIDKCKQLFMAIPISFYFDNKNIGHENMLFITIGNLIEGKKIITSELFEPHGSKFNEDQEKTAIIQNAIQNLVNELFKDKTKYIVQSLTLPVEHCPNINITSLQSLTDNSSFSGSCTIFSMLYSILKLLNPERSQADIADDIYKILQKNNNPTLIVKMVINALTSLLNIKKEGEFYYIIKNNGNKRKIENGSKMVKSQLDIIEKTSKYDESIQKPVSTFQHNDVMYNGVVDNGLFVSGKVSFPKESIFDFYDGKMNELRQMNDTNGILVWKNGDAYKGNFVDGKMTGKGIMLFKSGIFYNGEFLDGKMTGKGIMQFSNGTIMSGNFIDGKMTGKGRTDFKNGNVYEGDFLDGKITGKGILQISEDNFYIGDFLNGVKSGKGKFVLKSGTVIEGDFIDDRITGKAIIKKSNGDIVYEGDFLNDKKHGKGIYNTPDGSVYEGDFVDNKMTGKGIMTESDGGVYEGDFLNDEQNGKGIYSINGNIYEGDFLDGKVTGKGILKWQDGSIYEGDFINWNRTGKGKFTHADGRIDEGTFLDGKFMDSNKMPNEEVESKNGGKKTKKYKKTKKQKKTKKYKKTKKQK